MQRKRNEGGGWQAADWRFWSETVPPATKSITTFDAFRQNRDFHRML